MEATFERLDPPKIMLRARCGDAVMAPGGMQVRVKNDGTCGETVEATCHARASSKVVSLL